MDELNNLKELRETFYNISAANLPELEATWLNIANQLREFVLSKNPRKFLQWDIINDTMFVSYANYAKTELKYLKILPNWKCRWRSAIIESYVGHPVPYLRYPLSSCNLIHHAYHVAQFENKTNLAIHEIDFIFEFGGGYGSLCRLIHNLGFKGKYIIYDLPHFSALQIYYLKTIGLTIQTINELENTQPGIFCISDKELLQRILVNNKQQKHKLFIATWSLSEAPLRFRDDITPLVCDFQSYLIAFQDQFGEINNLRYFDRWKKSTNHINWQSWCIEHILGNHYLIGTQKSKTNND